MHDAGAVLALHGAQMVNATVIDQGVRKGAALVAMGGMAHQTALLGEHDEVVVLVADIEGNGLGNHIGGIVRLGQIDRNTVAGAHGILFDRHVSPLTATAPPSIRCAQAERVGQPSLVPR